MEAFPTADELLAQIPTESMEIVRHLVHYAIAGDD